MKRYFVKDRYGCYVFQNDYVRTEEYGICKVVDFLTSRSVLVVDEEGNEIKIPSRKVEFYSSSE